MAKSAKPFMTNYRKAFIEFKKTEDYKQSSNAMKAKGINQPYRDSILMNAFSHGWNATGTEIKML